MLSTQNKRCTARLSCSPLQHLLSKFSPKRSTSNAIKTSTILPSKHKIHSKCSAYFLCCTFSTVRSQHATVFTSQRITLFPSCLFQKDERALYGNIQSNILLSFSPSPVLLIWMLCLSLQPPHATVYSSLSFLILETVSINHILVVGLCLKCLESLQMPQQCTNSCSGFFCSLKAVSLIWGNPF